ncbi:D(2) dopamine receptor-like [Centroberyx affinis]|uniref:D(2) dopamine receptor-like n=1 Tax=Centroberyx affinis TaxID=166261 RepID=UPI003A5C5BDC
MSSEPAPAWGSGNNTVWEEYIDIAFLVTNCFILLITSFVGIAANLFVTWAVHHQKSLQTWNNALLVNLAVIDILRCAVDCPILLTIVMLVHQRGHVDKFICDAQVASFSFSCCIQLLTLACISAERYQAIAQPFKTSQRRRRIIVLIPLTWTLAILVAGFCLTFVKDSPVYVKCHGSQGEAITSYDTFGLYILVPLWTICFVVIIGFYARIFTIVRAHSRKIFDKGTFPLPKKDKTHNADEEKKEDGIGGENGNSKSDQNQTQKEIVAPVEQEWNSLILL